MAFSVLVDRPNQSPLELTPTADTVRFSSAAVGGFASCSFNLSLDQARRVPHLGRVRLTWGDRELWEGRVEDKKLSIKAGDASVDISCYGYARLLEETSVRRIWSMRTIGWRPALNVSGLATCGGVTPTLATDTLTITVGQVDVSDLTRVGLQSQHLASTVPAANDAMWAVYIAPDGITLVKMIVTISGNPGGGGVRMFVQDSVAGSSHGTSWNAQVCVTPNVRPQPETTVTFTPGARSVLCGAINGTTADPQTFEGFRILGTDLAEDRPGGYYGGTILRDLIALVPGLRVGIIEDGTEFALQSISRTVRDSVMSVVQEVAAYYDREWGVWEDRQFDWKAITRDEPDWIIPLSSLAELDLTASTEGLTRNTYLIYQNAVTGETEEKSEDSTDSANPYVRSNDPLDTLVQAPSVMTGQSATRLAQRIVNDRGRAPIARGRLTLPAFADIRSVTAGPSPAMFIRAGQNVVLPDVPTDDYFRATPGADGQTMFHVRSAETDMQSGTTTLELDAFTHRSDLLMARVAAVTRVFTGG